MNGAGVFLHWGVVQISLANFVVIVVMLVLFVLALVTSVPLMLPMRRLRRGFAMSGADRPGSRSWTVRLRERLGRTVSARSVAAGPAARLCAFVDLRLRCGLSSPR